MNLRQQPKHEWLTFTLPNGEQAAIEKESIFFFVSNREPVPHTILYTRGGNIIIAETFSEVAEMLGFTPPEPPPILEAPKTQIITPPVGIIRAH